MVLIDQLYGCKYSYKYSYNWLISTMNLQMPQAGPFPTYQNPLTRLAPVLDMS